MTDPAYQRFGLPVTASSYAVLRAAVRALHPDTRRSRLPGCAQALLPADALRACRATGGGRRSGQLIAPDHPLIPT
jgi:hypothetical protein